MVLIFAFNLSRKIRPQIALSFNSCLFTDFCLLLMSNISFSFVRSTRETIFCCSAEELRNILSVLRILDTI